MGLVSAVATTSARVWWVLRYWTPRAEAFRRRARSLELGIERQLTLELPSDDPWRRQVDADIELHPDLVPATAALVQASMETQPFGSRRWRRRQLRAMRRARLRASVVGSAGEVVATRRLRKALVRVVPVAAALAAGIVISPVVHHSTVPPLATGNAGVLFRYSCSQCTGARNMPVFNSNLSPDQRKAIIAYLNKLHAAQAG